MNTKKWMKITIASLAAIVIELLVIFMVALPAKGVNEVYKSLMDGDIKEAKSEYKDLDSKGKKKFNELAADFATYEVNRVYKNDINCVEARNILCSMADYSSKTKKKVVDQIVELEMTMLIKCYDGASVAYEKDDSSYYDLLSLYDDMCSDLRYEYGVDDIYDEDSEFYEEFKTFFDEKYDAYKSGELDYDLMYAYVVLGQSFFSGDIYSYVYDVYDELYYVGIYQEAYETCKGYYDDEEFMQCASSCKSYIDSYFYYDEKEDSTGYKKKFEELYEDAYEGGKKHYLDEAVELIEDGYKSEAEELLEDLEYYYGDDIDTAEIRELLREKWMTPYVEFVADYENNIKKDLEAGKATGTMDDTSYIIYEDNEPEYISLYDFDGNGTPELVFSKWSSSVQYIYTYDGSKVVFTGAFYISREYDGKYVAMPIKYVCTDTLDLAYELISLNGTEWTMEKYFAYSSESDAYEIDGEAATYEDVMALADEWDSGDGLYLNTYYLSDAESCIYGY